MAEEKVRFEDGQNIFFAKVYGKEMEMRYPLALHHLALMGYNPKWSIDMIVLFEKMAVFYHHEHARPFSYQQWRLRDQLHLTPDRLNKAREDLKKLKILNEDNPGRGKKIKFSMNRDRIIELLPEIFNMPNEVHKRKELLAQLENFFTYYLSPWHEYAKKYDIKYKRVNIASKRFEIADDVANPTEQTSADDQPEK